MSRIASASYKSSETLKFYRINVHLKLNSDVHETDLYEELSLFRKVVPQESSALDVPKFIF